MKSSIEARSQYVPLSDADVHVWHIDLRPSVPVAWSEDLSEDENERAGKFRFERDRSRWICSRLAMREILSQYMGIAASEIEFSYTSFGKPYIAGSNVFFNLSHSADKALFAVSMLPSLGIDIEYEKKIDFRRLAPRFFSSEEAAYVVQQDDAGIDSAFYRVWTRKEAFIKAVGGGLSMPLQAFSVSTQQEEPIQIKRIDWAPSQISEWSLITLNYYHEYQAALAVRAAHVKVSQIDFSG